MKKWELRWVLPGEDFYIEIEPLARDHNMVYFTHLVSLFWHKELKI